MTKSRQFVEWMKCIEYGWNFNFPISHKHTHTHTSNSVLLSEAMISCRYHCSDTFALGPFRVGFHRNDEHFLCVQFTWNEQCISAVFTTHTLKNLRNFGWYFRYTQKKWREKKRKVKSHFLTLIGWLMFIGHNGREPNNNSWIHKSQMFTWFQ